MASGEYYIAHNIKTDEYLAEKLFRGLYMTPDITQAVKCKTQADIEAKINKATVDYKSQLVVETITMY